MNEPLARFLAHHHHFARRSQLLNAGFTRHAIEVAWQVGQIVRVRNGIYCDRHADDTVVRAIRVGGAAAGPSAAALHGIWTPHDYSLTVSVRPNAKDLRHPSNASVGLGDSHDVALIRDGHHLDPMSERLVVSPASVVVQALRRLPPEQALATVDSALRLPARLRPDDVAITSRVNARQKAIFAKGDRLAESGTESIFRFHLESSSIPFIAQKKMTDRIRVDFLVAGFLVVECVSKEHHGSVDQFNADRERITTLVAMGYVVLEFTYPQIMFAWDEVWRAFMTALIQRPGGLRLPGSALCE